MTLRLGLCKGAGMSTGCESTYRLAVVGTERSRRDEHTPVP